MFIMAWFPRVVWCVRVRGRVEAKLSTDDVTMWQYRVDVVPDLPMYPIPGRC